MAKVVEERMKGSRVPTAPAHLSTALVVAVLAFGACQDPAAAELDGPTAQPGLELALDTLDLEVQSVWVRISAVPFNREDLILTWELEARTENPFWHPKVMRKAGGQSFEAADTARVWGNVPKAYDFSLIVSGLTASGHFVADTLTVVAPRCRNVRKPGLTCNPDRTPRVEVRGS